MMLSGLVYPLSTATQGAGLDASLSIMGLFTYVIFFIVILVLAYYSTRLLASAYDRNHTQSKIQVVDRRLLAQDKSITVIRVVDGYYILYTDRHRAMLIDKLSDYPETDSLAKVSNFQSILKKMIHANKDS